MPPSLPQVLLVDSAAAQLDRALAGMEASLGKLARKGAVAEQPGAVLARLQRSTELEVGGGGGALVPCVPTLPPPPALLSWKAGGSG